jgi:hypothetical protein
VSLERIAALAKSRFQHEQLNAPRSVQVDVRTRGPTLDSHVLVVVSEQGISSTPGRSAAETSSIRSVSRRTCFRSAGSNCQSFTKMVQPAFDDGVCDEVGGLRT